MTTQSAQQDNLVRVEGVSKSYGGVKALSNVQLDIRKGEVHALCGENGAGKSTVIKILTGSVMPDAGQVLVNGRPMPLGSVKASEAAGIAVIHQESVAFGHLNAQDNIFVGREPRIAGLFLDRKRMLSETHRLMARLGETIDPYKPVGELPMAQRQMVGMARALSQDCRLLIMDEPTASLSTRETEVLFRIIRQLKSEGVSILYVSHRMEEIFLLSDRVTVFRDGQYVGTRNTPEIHQDELIKMMVGRELLQVEGVVKSEAEHAGGKTILDVRNLTRTGVFRDISFAVRAGEIVGMAGLVGAGRSEVARAVFGADAADEGTVLIDGNPLRNHDMEAALAAGVALVPEDRQHLGLVLPMSVAANLSMAVLSEVTRAGLISSSREERLARELITDLRVKTANTRLPAQSLSGGNQQKLVIGKWLARKPRLFILDEPTRGVDVGAKAEIYKLIRKVAATGVAVWVISSDLPEVLLLSDRILVMRAGQIAGELSRQEATQEKVLALAMPAGTGAAAA
ncbi:MAG TPA: sugar ABC transporter ATP-binding protein [Phycisphaerae bacterium]|nr:sugar ABC transporter ATP-binding protein [Phycisphaerae bacterium]